MSRDENLTAIFDGLDAIHECLGFYQERGVLDLKLICRSGELFFEVDDLAHLGEEPGIDFGELEDLVDGHARAHSVADVEDAFGVGDAEFAGDKVVRKDVAIAVNFGADAPWFAVTTKAVAANFE
jgi:hypothetical protein